MSSYLRYDIWVLSVIKLVYSYKESVDVYLREREKWSATKYRSEVFEFNGNGYGLDLIYFSEGSISIEKNFGFLLLKFMFFSAEYNDTCDKFSLHYCTSFNACVSSIVLLSSAYIYLLGDLIVNETFTSGLIFISLLPDLKSICSLSLTFDLFLT